MCAYFTFLKLNQIDFESFFNRLNKIKLPVSSLKGSININDNLSMAKTPFSNKNSFKDG
jgi:hypothetical protein